MASIISELQVTFQSKSTAVFVSEINIRKDNRMAPQQHDTLPKSSDFDVEQTQKLSPVSNLGTSVESSPTLLPIEDAPENVKQPKEQKAEPSSDDSGSVQNYEANQEEFQSPLMSLQSALKNDGRIGKKLCLSNSLQKSNVGNKCLSPTSASMFEKSVSTSSTGFPGRNMTTNSTNIGGNSPTASNEMYRNKLCTATVAAYHNSLQTRVYDTTLQSSAGVYDSNLSSSSAGIYNGSMPPVTIGNYPGSLQAASKGIYHSGLPSTTTSVYDANTFSCRMCDFTCVLKEEYDSHMNSHCTKKCPHCNYTSRTEGRLKRHVKEFHSDTPPESWAGCRSSRKDIGSDQSIDNSVSSSNGKARTFRCKHCDFVAYQKADFWKHSKIHIKPDKLLQCPHCDFVTEFKHHYEYHLSNHFGRKPFQCTECNYKCVNKSMLNSHLKSHSNVYQFHCADCKYETKYCHSIKQHLKKQNHKPGVVLDQDGTPCLHQVIDVYGRRRGPRAKKRKSSDSTESCNTPLVPSTNHQPPSLLNDPQGMAFQAAHRMLQPNIPLYQSYFGDYSQRLMMRTNPQVNNSFSMPLTMPGRNNYFSCSICAFETSDQDMLQRHTLLHIASENKDIAKLYGINQDFFREQEMALNGDVSKQKNYTEFEERDRSFSSTAENIYKSHESLQECKQEHDEIVLETGIVKSEGESSPKYRRISSPKNDDENDSFREFSSPCSSSYSPDLVVCMKNVFTENRTSPNLILRENRTEENESPIDLSGRKSSDSTKTDKTSEAVIEVQSMEQKISPSASYIESSNVSSTSQRNRRKGKAYKLNHYMQYDEHSANQDFLKEDSNHNSDDSCEISQEDNKDSSKGQSETPLRVQTVFPDKRQNMNFPTTHTEGGNYSSARPENRSPSNVCTEPQVNSNGMNGHCPYSNLDRNIERTEDTNSFNEQALLKTTMKSQNTDKKQSQLDNSSQRDIYECTHCQIVFKNCAMYSVHKGYHGFKDPFTCNFCGHVTENAVEFFIHIARASHA